jgi:hypothetical protein
MKKILIAWTHIFLLVTLAIFPPVVTAQARENSGQLLKAYKTAHAQKDVLAMMALVLFQHGGQVEKASWKSDFEAESKMAVRPTIVPLATYSAMLSPEARSGIRPTIKLVNWLVVEYPAAPDNSSQRSGVYLIGIENGKAFIVGP